MVVPSDGCRAISKVAAVARFVGHLYGQSARVLVEPRGVYSTSLGCLLRCCAAIYVVFDETGKLAAAALRPRRAPKRHTVRAVAGSVRKEVWIGTAAQLPLWLMSVSARTPWAFLRPSHTLRKHRRIFPSGNIVDARRSTAVLALDSALHIGRRP